MRLHPQSSSALDPRVHPSRKTPVQIVVEQLGSLITVEPMLSLQRVFIREGTDGQQIITRRDMRTALNFCLPRPRQLHDEEYQILVNFLDPDQTNFVNVQDFINLFPKRLVCQCYSILDAGPGVVQSSSDTTVQEPLQSESQKTIPPKCDTSAEPTSIDKPLDQHQNEKPDDENSCEIPIADVKLNLLHKVGQLLSHVNKSQTDDGLDFFRKHMVDTLKKLDAIGREQAKLEIENTVYRFLRER